MNPAKEVGGDFCHNYFRIDDDHLCLIKVREEQSDVEKTFSVVVEDNYESEVTITFPAFAGGL